MKDCLYVPHIVCGELSWVSSVLFSCQILQQPLFAVFCSFMSSFLLYPSLSTPSLKFFCWCTQTAFLMSKGDAKTLGKFSATLDNDFTSFKFIPTCGEHADQG